LNVSPAIGFLATPHLDEATGKWNIDIEISRRFDPPDQFAISKEAEDFGPSIRRALG
jgi:hypothetical protein